MGVIRLRDVLDGVPMSVEDVTTENGSSVTSRGVPRTVISMRLGAAVVSDVPGTVENGIDVDVTRVQGTVTIQGSVTALDPVVTQASVGVTAHSLLVATLRPALATRRGLILWNNSTAAAIVKYGAGASATSGFKLMPDETWEMPKPIFVGLLSVIWLAAGTGAMHYTEMEP